MPSSERDTCATIALRADNDRQHPNAKPKRHYFRDVRQDILDDMAISARVYSKRRISTGRMRAAERAGRIVAATLIAKRRRRNPDRVEAVRVERNVGNRVNFGIQRNQSPAIGDPRKSITRPAGPQPCPRC